MKEESKGMTSFLEALHLVADKTKNFSKKETVSLFEGVGKVLAEDIFALNHYRLLQILQWMDMGLRSPIAVKGLLSKIRYMQGITQWKSRFLRVRQ